MKKWLSKNYITLIKVLYILPILIAAGVSISHVVAWYGLMNPMSWAMYLSIGVEIAALSALAGITTKISNWAYIPFIIVTFIQLVGNIFYSYQFIDVNGAMFKDWMDLVGGLYGHGDIKVHRQVLAMLGGAFIPAISLSFLHLLVSFTNDKDGKPKPVINPEPVGVDGPKQPYNEVTDTIVPEPGFSDGPFNPEPSIMDRYKSPGIPRIELDTVEVKPQLPTKEMIFKKWEEAGMIPKETVDEEVIEEPVDVTQVLEDYKKKKEQKVALEDIKEIKEEHKRNFSVNIPNRTNSIERIGVNKVRESGQQEKIIYKNGKNK